MSILWKNPMQIWWHISMQGYDKLAPKVAHNYDKIEHKKRINYGGGIRREKGGKNY